MTVCRICGEDRIPGFVTDRDVCRRCDPPRPLGPLPYTPPVYTKWDVIDLKRKRALQVEWARIVAERRRAASERRRATLNP